MSGTSPGARLRALIDADPVLVAPGAYDAVTARLVEANGFDAVYVTGGGVANALLGMPDIGLTTLTEVAEHAGRIAEAVDLPVFCDVDTGFGTAVNVRRTIRAFERAGVGGVHLEDQEFPKRCGHLAGKQLVPVDEMCGKVEAAVTARRDDDFVIIARTDAAAVEGFDGALARARSYVDAGADVIFVEALTSEDDFGRFAGAGVGAPLLANMTEFGRTPYLPAARFGELGFQVVIFPMMAFRSMLLAVDEALGHLRDHGSQVGWLDRMRTRAELYGLVDYAGFEAFQRRYVRGGEADE